MSHKYCTYTQAFLNRRAENDLSFCNQIFVQLLLKIHLFTTGNNMIEILNNALKRNANRRTMLAFLGVFLFLALVIFPVGKSRLEASSGGNGPIDLLISYTPEKAYSMIESYGDDGRSEYRIFSMTADFVFPLVSAAFFGLLLSWLFQRGVSSTSKLQMLNILPFGACLFDWLENLNIIIMLTLYPTKLNAIAELASLCTSIKWGLNGVIFLALFLGVALVFKNRIREQA